MEEIFEEYGMTIISVIIGLTIIILIAAYIISKDGSIMKLLKLLEESAAGNSI